MTNHLNLKIHTKEQFDKGRDKILSTDWTELEKTFHLECIYVCESLNATLLEKAIAISNLQGEAFGTKDERKGTLFPNKGDLVSTNDDIVPEKNDAEESEDFKELKKQAADVQSKINNILRLNPHKGPIKRGHGKRDLTLFSTTDSIFCKHESHTKGDSCPACKTGRLSRFESQKKTVVQSLNMVVVQMYELESLKCASCDVVTTAREPDEVKVSCGRYHPSAISQFANLRYLYGMPSHRLEKFTSFQGLRVPETTQFRLFEYACRVISPLFRLLAAYAANGKISFRDDSPMRINDLKRRLNKNQEDDELKAISTTVLTSILKDGNRITLYATSNYHAGNVIDSLLEMRTEKEPMLAMADALSANRKHKKEEYVIELNCLIHARRNFAKLAKFYPDETKEMIDLIGEIYELEKIAKNMNLTPGDRLKFYKHQSLTILNLLMIKVAIGKDSHDKKSSIFAAYQYIENHWPRLIGFIKHAGAPLDNSTAERDIKSAIRHRNNSLSYETEYGAFVGDVLMSVLKTADNCEKNPVEYLSYLLCNAEAVKKSPELFLPWLFESSLQQRVA